MLKSTDAYLVGYYGMRNSGDDALMHATAWGAKHILDCNSLKIASHSNYQHQALGSYQANLPKRQRFPGQNRLTRYSHALHSKRIIFGGGSVLHSESDINLKRHLMALSGSKNSLALGVSLGPFKSLSAEKACAQFLNECAFSGLRDQHSLQIARDIAPNANSKLTFDLAPLILCSAGLKPAQNVRNGIAFSLCQVAIDPMGKIDNQAETRRLAEFCQLISKLYENTGEAITLLEFNGHSLFGDWQVNHPIVTRLQQSVPITIKPYNPDPIAVLQDLSTYKALVSMRLHGSILAYLVNTPVLSLNYHQKCRGWCQQVGMPFELQYDLKQLEVDKLVCQIEQGLTDGFAQPSLAVQDAIKCALTNWSFEHDPSTIFSRYSPLQQSQTHIAHARQC
jgi:polysaccharide pyruvyl transferase WcaK-like protein